MTDKNALNKAVTAVMAEVHSLKKDEKNAHGSYNYVSVDSFKNLVRPLMAKHGLSLSMSETAYALEPIQGRTGVTVNARITYEFRLRHVEGAEDEPERATIMLPLTGAQTSGAAKSYALKEYLKGRFLVSTGDKDLIVGGADADAFAPREYTAPAPAEEPERPPVKPSITGKPGASKAAFRQAYADLSKAFNNAATSKSLKDLWADHAGEIDEWPTDFVDSIKVEYLDRLEELKKVLA
jgi:hypothetical protein